MGWGLRNTTFEDWIEHVFDHEVCEPYWFLDPESGIWAGAPEVTVAYITRLFEDPLPYMENYTDEQLNQGLWYIVGSSTGSHMFALIDPRLSHGAAVECVRSFYSLFEKVFAKRCSEHLYHLGQTGAKPLNAVCHMWWDIIPICGMPDNPSRAQLDLEALRVMARTLKLDSLACRESSLHGLGHWQECYPKKVCSVIQKFIETNPNLPNELLQYAKQALAGYVL